jgi:hypothetical protein
MENQSSTSHLAGLLQPIMFRRKAARTTRIVGAEIRNGRVKIWQI